MNTPTTPKAKYTWIHMCIAGVLMYVLHPYLDMVTAREIMELLPFQGGVFTGIAFTTGIIVLTDALHNGE